MRSIKKGRGPSVMGGFTSLAVVIFGIVWTVMAYNITRDSPAPDSIFDNVFPLFGVIFVIAGIVQAIYHFTNATSKNRFSEFDITDNGEETDPLNRAFGRARGEKGMKQRAGGRKIEGEFCPYCGATAQTDFDYCPKCGKDI